MKLLVYFLITSLITIGSCGIADANSSENNTKDEVNVDIPKTVEDESITTDKDEAKIVSVTVTGEAPNLTFNVGIESPDTGCDQYANWWEVITDEGALIYRRILAHSHVSEQPFVRSGSEINVLEDQMLIVRAHMNTFGYGTQVYKGTVSSGFTKTTIDASFAEDLATKAPLPSGCTH